MLYGQIGGEILYTVYSFYGGELDGQQYNREFVEEICEGHSPDNSAKRAMGCLCPRRELDKQPRVNGYYGPMWDGIRCVMADGSVKYDFEVVDRTKIDYCFGVLRYETEDVYDILSM